MKKVVFLASFILGFGNAYAFDINSYCREVGEVSGGSYLIMEACIGQELKAKNSL